MAEAWHTPSAVNSKCGEGSETYYAVNLIDENTGTQWAHFVTEIHWIILDMGESYDITKIQIYPKGWSASTDLAEVYITDNLEVLGDSLGSFEFPNEAAAWQEIDITDKSGRYIKLVTVDGTEGPQWYEFQVYGEVSGAGGYTLEIGSGSFVVTGQTVGLLKGWGIIAGSGTFIWTGFTATLTKAVHYILEVLAGAFALTGSSVTLVQKDGDYTIPRPVETDYVELTKPTTSHTELIKPTTTHTELTKPTTVHTELTKPTTTHTEE